MLLFHRVIPTPAESAAPAHVAHYTKELCLANVSCLSCAYDQTVKTHKDIYRYCPNQITIQRSSVGKNDSLPQVILTSEKKPNSVCHY